MTTLLRHAEEDLAPLAWSPETAPAGRPSPRDLLVEALEREVEELKANLAQADENQKQEIENARTEGRKEAEAQFARAEEKRLALLEAGIQAAKDDFRDKSSELEALALLLCEVALENVFERSIDMRELVTGAIDRQMSAVRREMVLGIHVSADDFTEDALEPLRARMAPMLVAIDGGLSCGEARIDLRLGHIDLSLPRYWQDLKVQLQTLAEASS
jgi:flagellar biosynthesis/type III secretory pathway protein FliH